MANVPTNLGKAAPVSVTSLALHNLIPSETSFEFLYRSPVAAVRGHTTWSINIRICHWFWVPRFPSSMCSPQALHRIRFEGKNLVIICRYWQGCESSRIFEFLRCFATKNVFLSFLIPWRTLEGFVLVKVLEKSRNRKVSIYDPSLIQMVQVPPVRQYSRLTCGCNGWSVSSVTYIVTYPRV